MSGGSVVLQGQMDSVAAVGRRLAQLDGLNDAMVRVRDGMDQLRAGGNARALTELIAACAPLEIQAVRIAEARVGAGAALTSYASEVLSLRMEVQRLRALKSEIESRRAAALHGLANLDVADPDVAKENHKLGGRLAVSESELQHVEQGLLECDEARLRADARCVNTLNAQAETLRMLTSGTSGASINGDGTVSLMSLLTNVSRTGQKKTDTALEALISGELGPEDAASAWNALELSQNDVKKLPIEDLFKLANVNGVPAWARDIASQSALDYAVKHPDKAYQWMGFIEGDVSQEDFKDQITALKTALEQAKKDRYELPGNPDVQMVGFGNHDGAVITAITFGNLDTASNVGVNVPGIGSNVGGIGNALDGAQELFKSADANEPDASYAIVTWYGYRSPGKPPSDMDVWNMDRADAGGSNLSSFLDGIHAFRAQESSKELERVVVYAHSYGSTTAAEALKVTTNRIDAFITYGSAGFDKGTSIDQLNVDHVYSTKADGDGVAGMGYWGEERIDPIEIDGVTEFSAEDGEERVTAHDMFTVDTSGSFWNWGGKVGYLTVGTSSLQFMGRVLAGELK